MLAPGEPFPINEDGSPTLKDSPGNLATSSVATATSVRVTPTVVAQVKQLTAGAIAGIAVGGFMALVLIGALLFILGRNKGMLSKIRGDRRLQALPPNHLPPNHASDFATHPPYSPGSYGPPPRRIGIYKPYRPSEPYEESTLRPPFAELSSPPLDRCKHLSASTEGTAYDDGWRQAMTPPLHRCCRHSELDDTQIALDPAG